MSEESTFVSFGEIRLYTGGELDGNVAMAFRHEHMGKLNSVQQIALIDSAVDCLDQFKRAILKNENFFSEMHAKAVDHFGLWCV